MQTLENKALSRGIIEKSAPILAEITIRKSQEIELRRGGGGCGHSILPQSELSRWVDGGTLYGKCRAETSPRRLSSGFYTLNRPNPYRRFADTAVCCLKISRPTTNLALISELSFCAGSGARIGRLSVCRKNGCYLQAPLRGRKGGDSLLSLLQRGYGIRGI